MASKAIAESLGINDLPLEVMPPLNVEKDGTEKAMSDFDIARTTLLQRLEDVQTTIAELMQLADNSQNARFYEVLAQHMKLSAEISKQLLDLQKAAREVKRMDGGQALGPQNVTNNLYVGTSADLLKLIKDTNKE